MNNQIREHFIKFLNELLILDQENITNLLLHQNKVNEKIANHPTVQVQMNQNNEHTTSTLGLLNGVLGNNFLIAAVVSEEGQIIEFIPYNQPTQEAYE